MSDFTRRVQEGVSSLLERFVVEDNPLSQIEEREFAQELALRKAAQADRKWVSENPLVRMAGPGEAAYELRKEAASAREARVRRQQEKQQVAGERAASQARKQSQSTLEADFSAWKEAVQSGGGRSAGSRPWTSSANSSSAGSRRRRAGFAGIAQDASLVKHYKTLGLSGGANRGEVKKAYRALMRKYHPDLHQDAKKKKAANELSVQVTQAYNVIDKYLARKSRR